MSSFLTVWSFQFLGIPPKGERIFLTYYGQQTRVRFQFLGIPPKGERSGWLGQFQSNLEFPISRDPPEGGTLPLQLRTIGVLLCFQFLGIPPKGEHFYLDPVDEAEMLRFQFLGIPPKGELHYQEHRAK